MSILLTFRRKLYAILLEKLDDDKTTEALEISWTLS
jgi:hypothetical protein